MPGCDLAERGRIYRIIVLRNGIVDDSRALLLIHRVGQRNRGKIETIADNQKSAQKKKRPNMVATEGLYKMCRCPNYFGEIIFWTGIFVSSLDILTGIGQWLMAVISYICIVFIMFNGAQRLEKRQMARYGKDKEYNDYANRTPIIIPFLPIYHLNKVEK